MNSEIEPSRVEQDLKALETFLVGNGDLDRLETLLDRFNIFEAIGMVSRELNHSHFLAYLLDPSKTEIAYDERFSEKTFCLELPGVEFEVRER